MGGQAWVMSDQVKVTEVECRQRGARQSGRATEILIGTSGLSVNKHVQEYHKVLRVSITF